MLAAGRLNSMKTRKIKLGVVAHDGDSNTQEAEAGQLPQDPGYPGEVSGAWCETLWKERELHTSLGIPGKALCTAHSAVNGQT